jgi:hypothetical protein
MTTLAHPTWAAAGGEWQVPFMACASRALGAPAGACPRCTDDLRVYFHVFQPQTQLGTASLNQFSVLEYDREEGFMDRLERLWLANQLGVTHPK